MSAILKFKCGKKASEEWKLYFAWKGGNIPDLFYEKYMNGEMEHKDTFNKRVLTEVPKYVLKKMSTSKNENDEKNEDVST